MVQTTWNFAKRKSEDGSFDEFWTLCPKKAGKPRAYKLWLRLKEREPEALAAVIQGMRDYASKSRRNATEERFLLHPGTFLSQRRWEDSVPKETPFEKEWNDLMTYVRRYGSYGQSPLPLSDIGLQALRAIPGGFHKLCMATNAGALRIQKEFSARYLTIMQDAHMNGKE